ncbi:hypothetical protein BDF22DRAFT_772292 [Syncephalis plumigaleata]|nr:hypothetical protein BDF22DRAFT_772292 [Syncephalis plumigaleata]
MFESLVANVLNKFLGDFVDNLEHKQLNIGIWSGDVTLNNLRLKKEALDRFNLPVDIKEGYLGSLVLKIPWSNLKGQPVQVIVKNVYLLAAPKVATTYNEEEEKKKAFQQKMSRLETAEMLQPKASTQSQEESMKSDSFTTQLVTKIVDNLQISISNIHIRYEDNVSHPGHMFALGITLHKLSAQSTDANWNVTFIEHASDTIHKLCKLECLAVYFNTETHSLAGQRDPIETFTSLIATDSNAQSGHQYILKPVSGVGQIKLNKSFSSDKPKTKATLLFNELAFVLDDEQYRDALLCLNYYHFSIRQQQYRKYRPDVNTTAKTHPREWFKFAGNCILSEIHERRQKWTWDHFARRRDERKAYVRLFMDSQLEPQWFPGSDDAAELAELERELSYEDIRFYRSIARAKLRKEKAYQDRVKRQQQQQQQQQKGGWLSSWWYGSNGAQQAQTPPEPVLSEQEMKALYDTIDFDEQASMFDCVLLALETVLQQGSLTLRYSPRSGDKDLVSVLFDMFKAKMSQRTENLTASMELNDFQIRDNTTPDTLYPLLAKVQEVAKKAAALEGASEAPQITKITDADPATLEQLMVSSRKIEPFLYVNFEHKPLDERADNAIQLKMRNIEFIYSRVAFTTLETFFKPPTTALESINALIEAAGDTFEEFKEKTLAGFEHALDEHKTMDVRVDIDAPIFILPESDDSGRIKIASDLASKQRKEECKPCVVIVVVGQSVEKCLDIVRTPDSDDVRHVLNRVNMSFVLETSILPDAFDMPAIKVSGQLPLLQINFSDRKYKTLMNILELISPPEEPDPIYESYPYLNRRSPSLDRVFSLGASDTLASSTGPTADGEHSDDDDDDTFYDAEDRPAYKKGDPICQQDADQTYVQCKEVVANIRRNDPVEPTKEIDLAVMKLQQFDLLFTKRPFEMNVDLTLCSIVINDMITQSDTPIHMLSCGLDPQENERDLALKANFTRVVSKSPDYMVKYEGIEQTLHVTMSLLNVRVETKSVLTLQDFLLVTFTDKKQSDSSKSARLSIMGTGNEAATASTPHATDATPATSVATKRRAATPKTKIVADMSAVSLVFADTRRSIAVALLEDMHAGLLLADDTIRLGARLGNFTMMNDKGDAKLLEFVYLHTGSMKFTFLDEVVRDLVVFANQFTQMQSLYDKAREAAVESAAQLQEQSKNIRLDVTVLSPILVLPLEGSSELIRAHLGEISLQNEFHMDPHGPAGSQLDNMKIRIRSIFVESIFDVQQAKLQQLQVIEDVHISLDLTHAKHIPDLDRPDLLIMANVSNVNIKLTQRQYKEAMSLVQRVTSVFSSNPSNQATMRSPPIAPSPMIVTSEQSLTSPTSTTKLIHGGDNNESQVWSRLDGKLTVGQVRLELFVGDGSTFASIEESSLSYFSLNSIELKFCLNTEDALEAELQLASFTVADSRVRCNNQFRQIVPAIETDNPQFMVHLSRLSSGDMIANATIDSPKVILVLDYLFALRDFALSGLSALQESNQPERNQSPKQLTESKSIASASATSTATSSDNSLSFRVNVVDTEIILLADPENTASEAMVLSASQLTLARQNVLTLAVDYVGMVLCRMDNRPSTSLRLVDEFNVLFSLNTQRAPTGEDSTIIDITVDPLIIRASYRDIKMIMGVANKASELAAKAAVPFEPPELLATSSTIATGEEMQRSASEGQKMVKSNSASAITSGSGAPTKAATLDSKRRAHILSREQLSLKMTGVQFALIGDVTEAVILDLHVSEFTLTVDDWSSELKMAVTLPFHANFFNFKNSHWEPVIEPWQLQVNMTRPASTGTITVNVSASDQLIRTMLRMAKDWQATDMTITSREEYVPYLIRNHTGYAMHVWTELYERNNETVIKQLANDAEIPWNFDDWRTRREHMKVTSSFLGIQLEGAGWESVKEIGVDREGTTLYKLRPDIDGVSHQIICEIKMYNTVKTVALMDNRGQIVGLIHNITPGNYFAVPIVDGYHHRLCIRPNRTFNYRWCTHPLSWKDFTTNKPPTVAVCPSSDAEQPPFHFSLFGEYDSKNLEARSYPIMTLKIGTPFELENLLPYDVKCRLIDNVTHHNYSSYMVKNSVNPFHLVQMGHMLLLNIEIVNTDFQPSEFAVIDAPKSDEFAIDTTMFVADSDGIRLQLKINRVEIPDSGGAFRISIYSPYVMINKTGLEMMFKTKSLLQSAQLAAGQGNNNRRDGQMVRPLMFSYPKDEPRNRALVKIAGSDWSSVRIRNSTSFGVTSELSLNCTNADECAHIGVEVKEGEGRYHLTKIVTFTPRFIVKNNLDVDIMFREPTTTKPTLLHPNQRIGLIYLRRHQEKQLTLRFQGVGHPWSSPFNISELGDVHIRMYDADGQVQLIRARVLMEQATIFIELYKETHQWPYRIENRSDAAVIVYQRPPYSAENGMPEMENVKRYTIPAQSSLDYAWDYPSFPGKLLVLNVNHRERDISLQEIGPSVPLQYPKAGGTSGTMAIDVYADGLTQVLHLSEFNPVKSVYRRARHSSISADSFEVANINAANNLSVKLSLAGVGISIINSQVEEIAYITLRGLEISFVDWTIQQSFHVICQWLQIDNQKFGAIYPIVLFPTAISRRLEDTEHPAFHLAVVRSKDTYFLYTLIEFANFDTDTTTSAAPITEKAIGDEDMEIPEPHQVESTTQIYFEVFHIQPIKLNLSYMSTDRMDLESDPNMAPSSNNPITFLIGVLKMAIGSISDAPIQMNALLLENLRMTPALLVQLLEHHYRQQAVSQIHRFLGSADALGNPVGLFNNITSGVIDIFYEPYQGFIMSDRPQDLGFGLVKGTTSFMKKTIFGLSDSVSKVTDTIGKGLTAATFDKSFQDRRRISKIPSGISGVITQPLAGAESEGVGGFFRGIGKGLVGVVAKPMVGVVDLATNVSEGIRNTTTVFDDTVELERTRLPRQFINYNEREAVGQSLLRNTDDGTFAKEHYLAHLELRGDGIVVILTTTRILAVNIKRSKADWDVPFSGKLREVKTSDNGCVNVLLKNNEPGPTFVVTSPTSIESLPWFINLLDEARIQWNNTHRAH